MKKVLMISPHLGTGGDWVFIKSLSSALKQKGYDMQLACNESKPELRQTYSKFIPIAIHQGLRGFLSSLASLPYFDRDIDIIHAHSTNTLLYALILRFVTCRSARIVFTFHLFLIDQPFQRWVKKQLFSQADCLHCSSKELVEQSQNDYAQSKDKIVHLCLGTDSDKFTKVSAAEKAAYRHDLNLSSDHFTLLFVGRLNPEKNVDLILDALSLEKDLHPQVKLLIVGDGPCREELKQKVQENALESFVQFLGYQSQMRSIYGAADLLILPSRDRETFGLVVTEAAFCGVPCLRSNTPGASDQIIDGFNGVVYDKNNAEEFSQQLSDLIQQPPQVQKMGEAACKIATEKFSLATMADRFDDLYCQLTFITVTKN